MRPSAGGRPCHPRVAHTRPLRSRRQGRLELSLPPKRLRPHPQTTKSLTEGLGQAPPKTLMFAEGILLSHVPVVCQLRRLNLTLPRVSSVSQGRLTVGEVVQKLLQKDFDLSDFRCGASDRVPNEPAEISTLSSVENPASTCFCQCSTAAGVINPPRPPEEMKKQQPQQQ